MFRSLPVVSLRRSNFVRSLLCMALLLPVFAGLTGCTALGNGAAAAVGTGAGAGTGTGTKSAAVAMIGGIVHGGQQPVSGSSVQLYEASSNGNGSPSIPLLSSPAITDANGQFTITGLYHCTSASALVYLVAEGGNPGLPGGGANSAIEMMVLLGPCGNLSSSTRVVLNEVTTVAAALAIPDYMSDAASVGYGGSIAGISSAFASASNYANSTTGAPTGANASTVQNMANLAAACVNSTGPNSTACAGISSATGGGHSVLKSLLYIARNSTQDFSSLYYAYILPNAPFQNVGVSPACPTGIQNFTVMPSFTIDPKTEQATISGQAGATLHYTLDGSIPGATSPTLASGTKIPVTLKDTLQLLQTKACFSDAVFSLLTTQPTISDTDGLFTLTNKDSSTTYSYTLDGSLPGLTSTAYTAAVPATSNQVFVLMAKQPGLFPNYGELETTLPLLSINGVRVTMSSGSDAAAGDVALTYTLRGLSNTSTYQKYTQPFDVVLDDVVTGCAKAAGQMSICTSLGSSPVPTVAINNGVFTVTSTDAVTAAGSLLFYTTDGSAPSTGSLSYNGPTTLQLADVVRTFVKAPGRSAGTPPSFGSTSEPSTVFGADGKVTITAPVVDGSNVPQIFYTTDGVTTPTVASKKYTAPFLPADGDVLIATAKAAGYAYSATYGNTAAKAQTTPTPSWSVSGGLTTMTDADTGAQIYYSVVDDGSVPATLYTAPFSAHTADIYRVLAKTPGKLPSTTTLSIVKAATDPVVTPGDGRIITLTPPIDAGAFYSISGASGAGLAFVEYTGPFTAPPFSYIHAYSKYAGYAVQSTSGTVFATNGVMGTLANCSGPVNGLAADRTGNVYAACSENHNTEHIYFINPSGSMTSLFSFSLANSDNQTLGLVVTPAGTLFVPDPDAKKVHRFANGIHSSACTGSVSNGVCSGGPAADHVFSLDWEQALILDGAGNFKVYDPTYTALQTVTDGQLPRACAGGLVQNSVYGGGVYCASQTAYLGALNDVANIVIPAYVGGLTMEVDGTMLLATRSSSSVSDSALIAIRPAGSPNGASTMLLTKDRTPGDPADGQQLSGFRLDNPMSLAADPAGNVYVGQANGAIRKLQYSQYGATAAQPVISVSGNAVTITSSTPGAVIYYSIDGSTPTKGAWAFVADSGTEETNAVIAELGGPDSAAAYGIGFTSQMSNGGTVAVPAGHTIKAIAVADSYYDSPVAVH